MVGEDKIIVRNHNFTVEDTTVTGAKISDATCTEKAKYYKSCVCGVLSTSEVFEVGEPHGHSFTDYISNGDATTEADGTKTAVCDHGCGATDTVIDEDSRIIEDCGSHKFISLGIEKHKCSVCGKKEAHNYDEATHICSDCNQEDCRATGNHDFSKSEYKNDGEGKHYRICALCTSESEHEACSGGTATCQKKAVCSHCKTEYGELAGHTWDAGEITKAATCKDKGVKTFKCTVTGCTATKTEDVEIDSSNHVNTEVLGKKNVTCTEDGYTGDTHCKDCDTTLHTGSVITATGHTWDAGTVTTPATCKTKGVKTFKCTIDGCTGTKTEDIAIDPSNHVNTEVVGKKDATCTEKGYTGDTHCKDCDETVTGTEIQATGHDMTKVVSAEVPATCEADGKEAVMGCKNCDHEEGGAVIPAKGHTWDAGTVTTPATCKTKGVKTFKCTVEGCTGTKTEEIAIDANNHVNTEVVGKKDATCTEKGYTGDTHCKDCDKTITKGTEIAATGHTWDSGKVTTEPTVTAEGVKTFTCNGCGATKTETIAKLPEPKKNQVIEDKSGNDYKVADPTKKEVTYKAPASKKAKTVTIPATVKNDGVTYKVTKIDDKAFKGLSKNVTIKVPKKQLKAYKKLLKKKGFKGKVKA